MTESEEKNNMWELAELINRNELITDDTNPNVMDKESFEALKDVIKKYGFIVPIITNKDLKIADGFHRWKAARDLGIEEVPVIRLDVDEVDRRLLRQVMNKLRGVHNKLADMADFTWLDKNNGIAELLSYLPNESQNIKRLLGNDEENPYTKKIESPIYTPSDNKPQFSDGYNKLKYNELVAEIEISGVTNEEKEFLKICALRHIEFNYQTIADIYAHSSPEVQNLMEKSALVIIDFEKAIEYGFVKLSEDIALQYVEDNMDDE